jgi:hypothetical protein
MLRRSCLFGFVGLVHAALLAAGPAAAQRVDEAIPLADLLEISFLGRDVVLLGGESGQPAVRLLRDERVLWSGSRGIVAVVITDQRVLAAGSRSSAWQEDRYRRGEAAPAGALLGDRLALLTTAQRALGFSGTTGNLIEYRLGPRETVVSVHVGENVGVVVTDRAALGLSPTTGGFFDAELQLHERIERVDTRAAVATVRTSRRLLVFTASTGLWSERRREINES